MERPQRIEFDRSEVITLLGLVEESLPLAVAHDFLSLAADLQVTIESLTEALWPGEEGERV